MVSDADLAAMSPEQRADLSRRLAVFSAEIFDETHERYRRRRRFTNLMVVCCVGLIPWIVVLALTLPHHYDVHHWTAAWVGFDVFLLVGLATTAWAGHRRRQILVVSALVTGTLLCTDAWFDVLTAATVDSRLVSLADAVLVELPLAVVLLRTGIRLLSASVRSARVLAGSERPDVPLHEVPLLSVDDPVRALLAGTLDESLPSAHRVGQSRGA